MSWLMKMAKDAVKKGYEKVAEAYASERDQFKSIPYLEKLIDKFKAGSLILDIGCGAGVPVDTFLVERGYRVMGIDIAEKMIQLAEKNVPGARYKVKDMLDLKVGEYKVDAIVSFYAIFHTPRERHGELFGTMNSFLQKGGILLVTMGSTEWEGEEKDFHGGRMWWSHYGVSTNRELVEKAGFEILLDDIDRSGGEKHQVIMARKR